MKDESERAKEEEEENEEETKIEEEPTVEEMENSEWFDLGDATKQEEELLGRGQPEEEVEDYDSENVGTQDGEEAQLEDDGWDMANDAEEANRGEEDTTLKVPTYLVLMSTRVTDSSLRHPNRWRIRMIVKLSWEKSRLYNTMRTRFSSSCMLVSLCR